MHVFHPFTDLEANISLWGKTWLSPTEKKRRAGAQIPQRRVHLRWHNPPADGHPRGKSKKKIAEWKNIRTFAPPFQREEARQRKRIIALFLDSETSTTSQK